MQTRPSPSGEGGGGRAEGVREVATAGRYRRRPAGSPIDRNIRRNHRDASGVVPGSFPGIPLRVLFYLPLVKIAERPD